MIKFLRKLENWFVTVLFIIMIIAVFAQVVNRNIVQASVGWFEELARYCMVCITILGAEMGLRDGSQISIEALTKKLSPKVRGVVRYFTRACVIVFAGVMVWYSIPLLTTQMKSGQLSPGLRLPMYIPYSTITIGFSIIFFVQIILWFNDLIKVFKNKEANEQKEVQA